MSLAVNKSARTHAHTYTVYYDMLTEPHASAVMYER